MAIQLSVEAQSIIKEIGIEPQIILDIEGVDLIFGARPVLKTAFWDDTSPNAIWDGDIEWDGKIEEFFSRDYIQLNGTTTNISQQIQPDKGSTSSISTVNISIVDKDREVSKLFSFDNITEVLGRKATFAIGFASGAYPEDSIPVFRGVIVDFYTEPGQVVVSLASPESLKRQALLEKFTGQLTSRLKYKELETQGLRFTQRLNVPGTLSIEFVAGAVLTASYNSTLNRITVIFISGVTTVRNVADIIRQTSDTFYAVETEIISGENNLITVLPLTTFQTDTIVNVDATDGVVLGGDALKSYIRVNDEIMEVVSKTPTTINVIRDQLNSFVESQDDESDFETFYTLTGKPLDLALKLMLSNEGNTFFESEDTPKSLEFVSLTQSITNALIFDYYDIQEKTGLVVGDIVQISTGTYSILEFGIIETGGSYIVVNGTLPTQTEYTGFFRYKSKYNVLPVGLSMLTSEVDVAQFELINSQFGSNFVDYVLYIKDTIDDAKDFIDQQIFFPQGLYSIPRKARSSVKFVAPPFSSDVVPKIDSNAILNVGKIKQRRSVHKYLYNVYAFKYELDSIDDKYLAGRVIVSSDSLDRINVGKKQLKIESDGLRNNSATTLMIESVGQRLVDRYQFAPVYYDNIEVNYKTGFSIEVGDVVPFGGKDLGFANLQTGEAGSDLALYEVINKTLNVKNGRVTLDLISTSFDLSLRYGVVSLASNVGTGSTLNKVSITKTNDTGEYARESDKWLPYVGQIVAIRSKDYSYYYEREFVGVDPANSSLLLLGEDLPSAPLSGYVIEPAEYIDTDIESNDRFKLEFAHFNAITTITGVTSATVFNVLDPEKLQVDSQIVINSKDYTRDSFGKKIKILSIVGNTVTVDASAFTPLVGDFVNNSNYADTGSPYALL